MGLEDVVDELYGLAPGDFTARRDELVRQAGRYGDRDLAKQVRALRRPTASAAAVNQLVREAPDELTAYLHVGERLREAQAGLQAGRLRSLSNERQEAASLLVDRAAGLAGSLGDSARHEVEETLRAAVADPAASDPVASGRLTKALSYAGFGEVDVTAATATPLSPQVRQPERSAARQPKADTTARPAGRKRAPAVDAVLAERRERADRELASAQQDAEVAHAAARRAHVDEQEAQAQYAASHDDVEALRGRLSQAREGVRAAQQSVVAAQGERARAGRAAEAAEKALQKARRRAGALRDAPSKAVDVSG